MKKSRRKFESSSKARVAIEALKGRETLSELALRFDLHLRRYRSGIKNLMRI